MKLSTLISILLLSLPSFGFAEDEKVISTGIQSIMVYIDQDTGNKHIGFCKNLRGSIYLSENKKFCNFITPENGLSKIESEQLVELLEEDILQNKSTGKKIIEALQTLFNQPIEHPSIQNFIDTLKENDYTVSTMGYVVDLDSVVGTITFYVQQLELAPENQKL